MFPALVYHRAMRRFPLLLLPLVLLSCGGSSGDTPVACDQEYWDGTLGTCLPEGWHVVNASDLQTRGAPHEVDVAFQANDALSGRFPLVTVTSQTLADGSSVEEFDEQSRDSVKTLAGYTLIDERVQEVDNQPTTLHIFTAQPIAEQPVQRFYQLSYPSDGKGYTFTGVLPLSVEKAEENKMLTLLTNVTFVEQGSGEE